MEDQVTNTSLDAVDNYSFDTEVCGNLTEEYKRVWKQYEYWCEGVLFSSLGLFGLISNIASIMTLLSPDMRRQTFNQLLAVLAAYDMLYILFNVPVHANATLETVNYWFSVSDLLSRAYVYVLYPMSAVAFCASIYMTLAVTVERYIAVCRPHQYRNISQTMSNTKRLLVYIVPVTVLSFALNIPKFMEVTLTQNNGTNEVDPSQTRRDPTFIFWYTLSLIWHPTLTTGVLPFIGLVYMNMKIFIGIRQSRQILSGRRSKRRQSESNLAITLVSIVFMHIVCNALRVFLGVLVVALVDVQVSCIKHVDHYIPPLWVMCLESVAHLLVMLNFSSNFLIYCSVSNQFKSALSKVCFFLCKPTSHPSPASEYHSLVTNTVVPGPSIRVDSPSHEMVEMSNGHDNPVKTQLVIESFTIRDSEEMKICRV